MLQETSRQPGQWVRDQARVHERRIWMLLGLVFALGALVVATYADARRGWLALVGVALLSFLRRVTHGSMEVAAHWHRGAASEEAVGKALDELASEGFTVQHDLRQEFEGNVDHLVSGPTGVFMIETKHRGYKPSDLPKARRQAKKLNDDFGHWVTPVICIDRRRARKPYRDRGVWIVSRERLPDWVRAQRDR
jgi:Nuclease-related domain